MAPRHLDRLVFSEDFPGKPVAIINASQRSVHVDASFRLVSETVSTHLVAAASITLPLLGRNLGAEGMAEDPIVSERLRAESMTLVAQVETAAQFSQGDLTVLRHVLGVPPLAFMRHGLLAPVEPEEVTALMVGWRFGGIGLAILIGAFSFAAEDPSLLSIRLPLFVVLASAALILGIKAFSARRRKTAAMLFASAFLVVWQAVKPTMDRAAVISDQGADALAVERHFVVGFDDLDHARDYVARGHVGGIFITQRNVRHLDQRTLAAMVASLQALRRANRLPPLIVTADQEGGPVSHLSPPLDRPSPLSTLADAEPQDRAEAARRLGEEQGRALRSVGVTMDLAPVVDLTPDMSTGPLDRHTQIGTRSISADPGVVATVAEGFSEGLLSEAIVPTAKHFPGLGRVKNDTHLFSASLDTPRTALQSNDWIPFRAVLKIPGAAVMLSHVALEAVDPGVPASRSKRVVTGLLRSQWGFEGLAITDDLTMGAVEHAGLCEAVVGALNAGIDLLLVSWDTEKVYPALRCALDGLKSGTLDPAMLARSARRLDAIAATSASSLARADGAVGQR